MPDKHLRKQTSKHWWFTLHSGPTLSGDVTISSVILPRRVLVSRAHHRPREIASPQLSLELSSQVDCESLLVRVQALCSIRKVWIASGFEMDIAAVTIITAAEALLFRQWQDATLGNLSAGNVLTLFSVQYVLLKYYRLVLYPNYFSPLRHLPGPSVSPPHAPGGIFTDLYRVAICSWDRQPTS